MRGINIKIAQYALRTLSLTDVIADQLWHLTGWLAPLAVVIVGLTSIALLNWWWR